MGVVCRYRHQYEFMQTGKEAGASGSVLRRLQSAIQAKILPARVYPVLHGVLEKDALSDAFQKSDYDEFCEFMGREIDYAWQVITRSTSYCWNASR